MPPTVYREDRYFHNRTGGFGRGTAALDHYLPSLVEVAGGEIEAARIITLSIKNTAEKKIKSNPWASINIYYDGWKEAAIVMLEEIKEIVKSNSEREEVEEYLLFVRNELP